MGAKDAIECSLCIVFLLVTRQKKGMFYDVNLLRYGNRAARNAFRILIKHTIFNTCGYLQFYPRSHNNEIPCATYSQTHRY